MAIKSEIAWKRRDPDGEKFEVYARRFGGVWKFYDRQRRNDQWQAIPTPTMDDWLTLLDAVERRVPRSLFSIDEPARIEQQIRQMYPEYRSAKRAP